MFSPLYNSSPNPIHPSHFVCGHRLAISVCLHRGCLYIELFVDRLRLPLWVNGWLPNYHAIIAMTPGVRGITRRSRRGSILCLWRWLIWAASLLAALVDQRRVTGVKEGNTGTRRNVFFSDLAIHLGFRCFMPETFKPEEWNMVT